MNTNGMSACFRIAPYAEESNGTRHGFKEGGITFETREAPSWPSYTILGTWNYFVNVIRTISNLSVFMFLFIFM